ncbi:MAG: TetR/AcrR family transcriptional regulator [Gemmatimonadota bacterium]|nr:TetR/AcrR family transcriptional regulator [Gemmatimonadota bacterium]
MLEPRTDPAAHLNPPKQHRSRRTLERIVEASLELLATEGPSGLTVHKVVDKADSSVGSFYARFKGKDDLLDYLGDRIWTEALDRWNDALASRAWGALSLSEMVEGSVGLLIDAQRSRSAYLRALDWAAGGPSDAYTTFRTQLLVGLGDILLRRRLQMTHPNPELAVRLGLRAVLGVVESEFRAVGERLPRETLVEECRVLLLGYLTGETLEPGSGEGVEFFDVWS